VKNRTAIAGTFVVGVETARVLHKDAYSGAALAEMEIESPYDQTPPLIGQIGGPQALDHVRLSAEQTVHELAIEPVPGGRAIGSDANGNEYHVLSPDVESAVAADLLITPVARAGCRARSHGAHRVTGLPARLPILRMTRGSGGGAR